MNLIILNTVCVCEFISVYYANELKYTPITSDSSKLKYNETL